MGNAKSLVLVITSLTFLVSGAICSQLFVYPVFAAPPDPCFGAGCPGMDCINYPETLQAACCWTDVHDGERVCQACNINTDTGEFENCTIVSSEGKLDTSTVAPPPSGVAPPSTEPGPGKGGPGNVLPEGVFEGPTTSPEQGGMTPEVAPLTGPEGDDETQSRFTSPTGGCIPFIETQCVPCDPGLPGADCISETDWETTIGTTAARGAVACGPPPMPACGPHSPPPPPPPTNHVVKGPQIGELPGEEAEQPATVEEQPMPVCQEGLEFNEDLGFCVPTECPEGQELNEETGICVLEEQPAAAEEPEEQQQTEEEQPQPEGEQPSEESGSEEDNSNN